jgi:ubiquinone/menaquinone biosynthesis C-methylase UbiE
LNIPDILKQAGPLTAPELAARGVAVNAAALERVMRLCSSVGLFTEDTDARFGATPLSEVLTADSPASIKALAQEMGGLWLKMWGALADGIRTGEPQSRQVLGSEWWDYLKANPNEMETFAEAMKSNSETTIRGILEHCDFASVDKVVDVGGGVGHLVVALLDRYPNLRGVLQDVPDLIAMAQTRFPVSTPGIRSRLEYVGADMFEAVPRADAYVLSHIIHDWDDEHCIRLLKNCHAAMEGEGRLICVDAVLPPMGDTSATPAKVLDVMVMLSIGGRERTSDQWQALYRAAGFRISSIIPIGDNFGGSIVEGVKQRP